MHTLSHDTTYRGILDAIPTASIDEKNTIEVINQLVDRVNYIYSIIEPDPNPANWTPPNA
jgi:hypothetical protein